MKRHQSLIVPVILGSIVCALILTFINPVKQKFTLQTRYLITGGDDAVYGAWDYNEDGNSEIAVLGIDMYDKQYLKGKDGQTELTHWQISMKHSTRPIQFEQLSFFKFPDDSLYCIAFLDHTKNKIDINYHKGYSYKYRIPGTRVYQADSQSMSRVKSGLLKTYYLERDSLPQLLFDLSAGWDYEPRNLYRYDPNEDTLYCSPISGGKKAHTFFVDVNKDGISEIVTTTPATSNFILKNPRHREIPYADTSMWIMIYNQDLTYYTDPIKVPGLEPEFTSFYSPTYRTLYFNTRFFDPDTAFFYSFSFDSLKIKQLDSYKEHKYKFINDFNNSQKILLSETKSNNTVIYNPQKHTFKRISGDFTGKNALCIINNKGLNEEIHIYHNPVLNKIYGFSSDYKHTAETECILGEGSFSMYPFYTNGQESILINTNEHDAIISAHPVPLWKWRYLIWFGIWLASVGFVIVIWMLAQRQARKRYELKAALDKYKILAIHNQLNPHFIFNIINTLAGTLYMDDKSKAHNYFGNFSKLLRITINSSDQIDRTLSEEIEFTRNYLELQVLRSNNIVSYEINLQEGLPNHALQTKIPGLIIHTFVENALKHGFPDPKYLGKIIISIEKKPSGLKITISDNGIGHDNAKQNSVAQSTGKGLKLLQEKIDLFNEINKCHVQYIITEDMPKNTDYPGVRVEVII